MNCPGACLVYASGRHSYRELPLRLAEFGLVSRYEREGVLHGLLRVRAFTQDDAHVYCTLDQVTDEVDSICAGIDELYERFGFDEVRVELSTRPEKSIGTDEQWERAEGALREALERQGREYDVSPGEGTFYGPKIDFHITDALGRSWQCGTCQLDFQMPERFELSYTGADNAEHRPVMIHRALLGSMERFAGILIEHYGGRFPLWLAPVQAVVLPVADRHNERAREIADALRVGRPAGARRRPHRVRRQEDPRRRALQGALHAGRGRQGSRVRLGLGAPPRRRGPGGDGAGGADCANDRGGRGLATDSLTPGSIEEGCLYWPQCRAPTPRRAPKRPVPASPIQSRPSSFLTLYLMRS